jgi:hypothetical protein
MWSWGDGGLRVSRGRDVLHESIEASLGMTKVGHSSNHVVRLKKTVASGDDLTLTGLLSTNTTKNIIFTT